jgi:uncharacterized protein (DUF2235 family)
MKRLSVFLDGTWNDPASDTNVYELCRRVAANGQDGTQQVKPHYDPGVGTKKFEKLRGGAVGMGLSGNVRAAYQWLLDNYVEGDEVYIFGFSRGAYTARSLGGLIAGCGLAMKGAPFDVQYLYERYQHRKESAAPIYQLSHIRDVTHERALTPEEESLLQHSRRIQIRMIGVWDTVGALGVPWTGMPLIGRDNYYFHNPNLSQIYDNAFQALAVDENRGAYKPTLWTRFVPETADGKPPPPPAMPSLKNVEQRWFIGAHANVGGGYPGDRLNRLPLAWLQSKAESLGLHFSETIALAGDEHMSAPVDSYGRFLLHAYQILTLGRRYWRPIGVPFNRVNKGWSFPVNEYIDASVFCRCADVPGYRPKNLLDWCDRMHRQPGIALGDQAAL